MALGDRPYGSRTIEFDRRINALQAQPRPLSGWIGGLSVWDNSNHIALNDGNGNVILGKANGANYGYELRREGIEVVKLFENYPPTYAAFPERMEIYSGYCFFKDGSGTKYRYDIEDDTYTELTSADTQFLNSNNTFKGHGGYMFGLNFNGTLYKFDFDGVKLSTVALDDPINYVSGNLYHVGFDFDGAGRLVIAYALSSTYVYVTRYNTSGAVVAGTFSGEADEMLITNYIPDTFRNVRYVYLSCDRASGYFVIAEVVNSPAEYEERIISCDDSGVILATDFHYHTPTAFGFISGLVALDNEIWVSSHHSTYVGRVEIFTNAGVLLDTYYVKAYTSAATQTEFHRYPQKGTETGKVSFGTPDGGHSIPALDALSGKRPSAYEVRDMRAAIEAEAVARRSEKTSGVTTSTSANKLVDSGQSFTSTVAVGSTVYNHTDGTTTTVSAVDSDTTLSLNANIMASGETYLIVTPYTITAGANNIFRLAIDSGQDDWTTPTVELGTRLDKEDVYNDIDLVLTHLENSKLLLS